MNLTLPDREDALVFPPLASGVAQVKIQILDQHHIEGGQQVLDLWHSNARDDGPDDNSVSSRLAREADVVVGGAAEGVGNALANAVSNPATIAKLGGSFLVGGALTGLEVALPELRPMGCVITGAFTLNLLSDVATRVGSVASAVGNTWDSPANLSENRQQVGDAVGPFAVDTGLMIVGGWLGNFAADRYLTGANGNFVRIPTLRVDQQGRGGDATLYAKSDPLARLYDQSKDSIVSVNKWFTPEGGQTTLSAGVGTGFFVSEDGNIVTNSHVAGNVDKLVVTTSNGERYWAKVLDVDHEHDLAMLYLARQTPGTVFRPLKIADALPDLGFTAGSSSELLSHPPTPSLKSSLPAAAAELKPAATIPDGARTVATIGYPNNSKWNKLFLSPGKLLGLSGTTDLIRTPLDPALSHEQNVVIEKDWKQLGIPQSEGKMVPQFDAEGKLTSIDAAQPDAATYFTMAKVPAYNLYSHTEGGNSGSPVLNLHGEVIGIATRGGATDTSIATPSPYIREFLNRQNGKVIERLPPFT